MTAFQKEYNLAATMKLDAWVPACGGTEEVFTVHGKRFLYCYNPKQHKHAYLDVDSDMIMSDEDYFAFIGKSF
jgi:hypothetical protein